MKYKITKNICSGFMTEEQLARMCEVHGADIAIDVHGMKTAEALRQIRNIIAAVSRRLGKFVLLVIHGYRNGHSIRDSLRRDLSGPHVTDVRDVRDNPGRTQIMVTA